MKFSDIFKCGKNGTNVDEGDETVYVFPPFSAEVNIRRRDIAIANIK